MIKNLTKAEYDAFSPSSTESTIVHISDTNEIFINGVMVVTPRPQEGDICVLDEDKNVRYITLDSFNLSLLPSDWVCAGFVEWVRGGKVKISRVLGSYKWAQYFPWNVTGYSTDGESHSFSFAVTVSGVTYTCSGTYSGTTLAEVATSMNAVVEDFDFGGHSYHVYVRDELLILQHDTYTTYLAVTATGVSVAQYVGTEIAATSLMPRRNGQKSGAGSVANLDRALIYFRSDLSSTTYNPSSDVTSIAISYPVCLPAYLGTSSYQDDHCAVLRNYYGAGEAGWIEFMKAMMAVWPSKQGVFDPYTYGDGKTNTYALAGQTCEAHDGSSAALYPAFDAVAAFTLDAEGLSAGDWYLGTIGEIIELKSKITYPAVYQEGTGSVSVTAANADVFSRAMAKMNFTQFGNSSNAWSSSRYYAYYAWNYNGNNGSASFNYYYNAIPVLVSAVLSLPQSAD